MAAAAAALTSRGLTAWKNLTGGHTSLRGQDEVTVPVRQVVLIWFIPVPIRRSIASLL